MYQPLGRKLSNDLELKEGIVEPKKWYQSKTIWTAVITGVLGIAQAAGQATGHPVTIPPYVYEVLAGLGLYSLRTGDKPIA